MCIYIHSISHTFLFDTENTNEKQLVWYYLCIRNSKSTEEVFFFFKKKEQHYSHWQSFDSPLISKVMNNNHCFHISILSRITLKSSFSRCPKRKCLIVKPLSIVFATYIDWPWTIYCIINQIRIDFARGSTLDLRDPSLFVYQLYSIYFWQETRFPPNSTELSLTSLIPSDFSLSLPRKDGLYFSKFFSQSQFLFSTSLNCEMLYLSNQSLEQFCMFSGLLESCWDMISYKEYEAVS